MTVGPVIGKNGTSEHVIVNLKNKMQRFACATGSANCVNSHVVLLDDGIGAQTEL